MEAHETTKDRFADQETQVGMAGPYTLRKPNDDITRQALEWNPQGKRSRGRPKNMWRRTVLVEAKGVKQTWAQIKYITKNRVWWRNHVDALCSAAELWDY